MRELQKPPSTYVALGKRARVRDATGSYLRSIGRLPLLTGDQEIMLGRDVQAGNRLLELKQDDMTDEQWANAAGMGVDELHRVIANRHRAINKLIEHNLRLAVSVASKYVAHRRHMELLDLVSEGNIGLRKAAEKFDPTRGYRFSTYAYWWVWQSVTRSIKEKDRSIRVPVHLCETWEKAASYANAYHAANGRKPKPAQIAEAIDKPLPSVEAALDAFRMNNFVNLDGTIMFNDEGDDKTPLGLLRDERDDPMTQAANLQLAEEVLPELLARLTPTERMVLEMHWGLNGQPPVSYKQIGEEMLGAGGKQASNIARNALGKLRRMMDCRGLSVG